MKEKAVILLSGGMDSSTCLAIAKSQNYECYALSFVYGQRNEAEIKAAFNIAKLFNVVDHQTLNLPTITFQGSSLINKDIEIEKGIVSKGIVPSTYVPARNTVFLAFALAWCEVIKAKHIFIGVNAVDYSNYPDCRPDYIDAFNKLANLAINITDNIHIHAPLQNLTKAEIIRLGSDLGLDYSLTISCYNPSSLGHACGVCPSCCLRHNGFIQAGLKDNTLYV